MKDNNFYMLKSENQPICFFNFFIDFEILYLIMKDYIRSNNLADLKKSDTDIAERLDSV